MKYISLKKAKAGMELAYDVRDRLGRVLVSAGSILSDAFLDKLKLYGFNGLYIRDALSEGIEIGEALKPEMRLEVTEKLQKQDVDACINIAQNIVASIMTSSITSFDLADLRSFDDYTFSHSINVAVYSCVLGMGMNLNRTDLNNLVVAALLHDLGKLQIPLDIINKPGRLTGEEYEIIKNHPMASYQLIADREGISAHVKNAVLHHHENVDGSGYPDGITSDDMSLLIKIIHVADVYDALVSRRPYKEPYAPVEAVEYLMGGCGILFDKTVVEQFIKYVALYPKGTEVLLSDGRKGIVYENSGVHNMRPIIRLDDFTFVDLIQPENLSISIKIISEEFAPIVLEDELTRNKMINWNSRPTLVLVDDLVTNLHMLKEVLETDYKIIMCKSGVQALTYLSKTDVKADLVIMDIDMPEMSGIDTTAHIREMQEPINNIPVLFVTSLHDKGTVLACHMLKGAGYIVRPYNPTFVKTEVRRILRGR